MILQKIYKFVYLRGPPGQVLGRLAGNSPKGLLNPSVLMAALRRRLSSSAGLFSQKASRENLNRPFLLLLLLLLPRLKGSPDCNAQPFREAPHYGYRVSRRTRQTTSQFACQRVAAPANGRGPLGLAPPASSPARRLPPAPPEPKRPVNGGLHKCPERARRRRLVSRARCCPIEPDMTRSLHL